MIKLSDVKINIATAIAAAFGFVIALLWKEIIVDLLKRYDLWLDPANDSIIVPIITALVVTVICVIGIMYITKWGGVDKK